QMTGVEGYLESTSSGWLAGTNAARRVLGLEPIYLPSITGIGALANYVSNPAMKGNFQPMNVNFGLFDPLDKKVRGGKAARNEAISERSLEYLKNTFCIKVKDENNY
ncbi:MAG: FAD-dependent oxidoreductase, partial [Firmicutes bacterium]|nr:FAD-dependent oxidoreductase [Candidatus Colimorpha enterica]